MSSYNHSGSDDSGSSSEQRSRWGTIYSQGRAQSLEEMEYSRSSNWTRADEEQYLHRVKTKAVKMASEILEKARVEATAMKAEAHEEGFNQGLAAAQEELDLFRVSMGDSVSAVLSTIEGQCSHIFTQWRDDLVGVAQAAVEKICCVTLAEEKRSLLTNLLSESVGMLEKQRSLTIRVNPEDAPVIADIIAMAQEKTGETNSWQVRSDSSVSPGGMVIENEYSLAVSTVESRKAAVNEVFRHLTLPAEP